MCFEGVGGWGEGGRAGKSTWQCGGHAADGNEKPQISEWTRAPGSESTKGSGRLG